MAYRRRRYSRRNNKNKYSVEQTGFALREEDFTNTNGLYQSAVEVVPSTAIQGMRKVKHLTVNLTTTPDSQAGNEFYWALVFVPEGYTPNTLFGTTGSVGGSMYNPNQFVMNCGIVDPDAGPIRFGSPISRNLNSGDRIFLIVGLVSQPVPGTTVPIVQGVVRYAITLQ